MWRRYTCVYSFGKCSLKWYSFFSIFSISQQRAFDQAPRQLWFHWAVSLQLLLSVFVCHHGSACYLAITSYPLLSPPCVLVPKCGCFFQVSVSQVSFQHLLRIESQWCVLTVRQACKSRCDGSCHFQLPSMAQHWALGWDSLSGCSIFSTCRPCPDCHNF